MKWTNVWIKFCFIEVKNIYKKTKVLLELVAFQIFSCQSWW